MDGQFTPMLTTRDWNEEWKALQTARERSDDSAVWDAKAKSFPVKHGSQQGYVADAKFALVGDHHVQHSL